METALQQIVFPQITASEYQPCTIPYRFPSDPPEATPTEIVWLQFFRKSIASFKKTAELDDTVPMLQQRLPNLPKDLEQFWTKYRPAQRGMLLCRLREICLREVGFVDIYKKIKDVENAKSLALLEAVINTADSIQDEGQRIEHLVKRVCAGNIVDLGAAELADRFEAGGCSFKNSVDELLPQPWVIDDLDKFKDSGCISHGKRCDRLILIQLEKLSKCLASY